MIDGTPSQNGRLLGRLWKGALRARIIATRKIQKKQHIADALLRLRIREFTDVLRKATPQWLDEAKGISEGAGIAVDDLLMLNCLPPGFYPPGGNNCTTFISASPEEIRLLKIRDERNRVQTFYIRADKGTLRYQAGHDIGNMGVAHFFNNAVVAGANNTGSPIAEIHDQPLLNDCHLMRYFAERARRVKDIPLLLEKLLEKKLVGGASHDRGSIFICADRDQGLILECHSKDYAATFVEKGLVVVSNHFHSRKARAWESKPPNRNTLLRKKRMEELLNRYNNNPTPRQVFAITRDRKSNPHSLCNDDSRHFWMTISVQLQIINRRCPENSRNYICCGNTRNSVYLPISVEQRESFLPLAAGAFYQQSDRLYRKHGCSPHLDKMQRQFERSIISRPADAPLYRQAWKIVRSAR